MEQELHKNPFAQWEDKADESIPTGTLQIYNFISDYLKRDNDSYVNRASAATMCKKRRWYQRRGEVGTPLTPRKEVNFLLGDLAEKAMVFFIKNGLVGEGKLYSEVDFGKKIGQFEFSGKVIDVFDQKTLISKAGDVEITCHADGFGKRNLDGKWESIECKSSSDWGFKSFQQDGPGDYLKQSHTVMSSDFAKKLGVDSTRYFYLKKQTGHLWDRLENFQKEIWEETKQDYIDVMSDKEMEAPHDLVPYFPLELKPGNVKRTRSKEAKGMIAEFPCTYCPYLKQCHGEYEIHWTGDQWGNKKPTYLFKESE